MSCYVTGVLVLCLNYVIITTSHRQTFNGYQLLEVPVNSEDELFLIRDFMKNATEEVDVWHEPDDIGDGLHVLLQPAYHQAWDDFCRMERLECSVLIHDVQKLLEDEVHVNAIDSGRHVRSVTSDNDDLFTRLVDIYPSFDQIEQWLKDLNSSESLVTLSEIGKTYEGRPLYVIKITGSSDPDNSPAIWIDTGIHSREWITHTSSIYIITQLIQGYHNNTSIRPLVADMVWYFMPVVNPDGYVFSHTENRFWRKNRSPPPEGVTHGYENTTCLGVDLNRNWDFHWGEVGVSTNSCWVIYAGHEAVSELETRAVSQFIQQRADNIHGFVSIHSYGQMFLTRWAYVNDTPSDHHELYNLAKNTAEAMEDVHGTYYRYGLSPRILYPYSGGSPDWAKGVAKIKYSYSVELRDRGEYGFLLPTSFIKPVGEEIFTGLVVVATQVMEYGQNVSKLRETTTTTTTATTSTTATTTTTTPTPITITDDVTAVNRDVTPRSKKTISGATSSSIHPFLVVVYLMLFIQHFTVS